MECNGVPQSPQNNLPNIKNDVNGCYFIHYKKIYDNTLFQYMSLILLIKIDYAFCIA